MEATGLIFPAIRVGDVSVPPVADLLPTTLISTELIAVWIGCKHLSGPDFAAVIVISDEI
ncbi:hypothetical protein EGR_02188 [Echinococcus granulosus]|uniref:Uncharacterized protein n=1 Tax=Echinococcus granulosus TaxID=6210 RepID=W6V957_ECHGR|nr:hypothetical protein EGR_02188 [Echinococcus granulosus]EUB63094.1 hypothetical protein EGR_02188 [Echinococcus granulosus]